MGKLSQNMTQAGNLTDVSATMSNSRFSFYGEEANGETSSNIIDISLATGLSDYIDGSDTLTDTLKIGDSLTFTTDGAREIEEVIDADTIRINSSLSTANDPFYLKETTDLTVTFTTNSYIAGDNEDGSLWDDGYFEVLVPAAASSSADNIPDQGFFDFGSDTGGTASTVTCTNSSGGNAFSGTDFTQLATSGQSVSGYTTANGFTSSTWHTYRCNYDGGDANDDITMTIQNLINPVPASDHNVGEADTYDIIVRHMNGTSNEIDVTRVKIGAVEAVKVSATVLPTLTFEIDGIAASETICGSYSTSVATTANSVPLGDLSTGSFTHAGQGLSITTNAVDGASVTAVANDQLGLNGAACAGDTYNSGDDAYTCIWDHHVDGEASGTDVYADHDSTQGSNPSGERDWANNTDETGFGFSLDDTYSGDGGYSDSYTANNANPDFYYNQDTDTFAARHFASAADSQDPQKLFDTDNSDADSDPQPTNSCDVVVCYRAIADALTAAGDYYNYITYTATAQF
jgi:hypothetical protein